MDLNAWVRDTKLVVCVGSGGVGKTTTAAAMGLWGAMQGRKVMVLTIDPARRLANSLGLSRFGNEEARIDLSSLAPLQGQNKGELWAMMLDSQRTFDDLVARFAPDPVLRDRILQNHVYRHMSETFAGSQDYMATEKLFDVAMSGRYDMVVLDTPPVKNALDFLESPGRLVNFLDERVLKWFLTGGSSRFMFSTSNIVMKLLGHIFGREFLDDLALFFNEFQVLLEGFRERHQHVLELLHGPETSFVTVCAPTEPSVEVATFFQDEFRARGLPRAGVVVNQVHRCAHDAHDADAVLGDLARELGADLPPEVVASVLARLGMSHHRLYELAEAERGLIQRVRGASRGGGFLQQVPRLEGEVHDLPSLLEVGRNLFTIEAERV